MNKDQINTEKDEEVTIRMYKDEKGCEYVNAEDMMSYFEWERKQMMKEYPFIILIVVVIIIILGILNYLGVIPIK